MKNDYRVHLGFQGDEAKITLEYLATSLTQEEVSQGFWLNSTLIEESISHIGEQDRFNLLWELLGDWINDNYNYEQVFQFNASVSRSNIEIFHSETVVVDISIERLVQNFA